jgi:hypothetical protein
MHALFVSALAILSAATLTLFDFNNDVATKGWRVVDDVVMGGRSSGNIELNEDGHAHYFGSVSLENNGGFSSVRHRFETINTSDYSTVILRVKGDGKKYQFRLKTSSKDYYSYVFSFPTSGEWETIEIPFTEFYPSWRGQKLDMPNYAAGELEEVAFLIANYKNEDFDLLIDKIELK